MEYPEDIERRLPPVRRCRGFGRPIDPAIAEQTIAAPPPPERETPSALQRRLAFAARQAALWVWVETHMRTTLAYAQEWSIRYRDLEGLSYAQAGARLGVHAVTVKRSREEGIQLLRELAAEENVSWDNPPPRKQHRLRRHHPR